MSQLRKPTRDNKILMSKHNLVPENWLVIAESKTDLEVVSRRSGRRRVLEK